MPIDASIALGVKPAQIESPMNQMAQMYQLQNAQSQNELAKYTIDKAQREDQMQNALYARLQDPTFDPTNAAHVKGLYQYGTPGIGVIKSISEQGEKALQQKKIAGEIATSDYALKTKQHDETIKDLASTSNPTDAAAAIDRYVTDKKLTADEAAQIKASIPTDSTQYGAWQTKMLTHLNDAKTQLEITKPNLVERNNGQLKWFEDINSRSPTFGKTQDVMPLQASPDAKLAASTQRTNQTETARHNAVMESQGKVPPGYRLLTDGSMELITGGPADTKAKTAIAAQSTVDDLASTLGALYDQLGTSGGIVSTKMRVGSNVMSRLQATGAGQFLGGAAGTDNQTARDTIAATRPLLLQAIKTATGMSAKQMDSNVELKMYLAAATDPTKSLESNKAALANLVSLYGVGGTGTPGGGKNKPIMPKNEKMPSANPHANKTDAEIKAELGLN